MSFKRDIELELNRHRTAKREIAHKYAKYKVGDLIRHSRYPDPGTEVSVIEDITHDSFGGDHYISYWLGEKNGRCKVLTEGEIISRARQPRKKK